MERPVDFILRSPLALGVGLRLYDALSWIPPFDTSWRHLERWQTKIDAVQRGAARPVGRRILMLCYYSFWVDFALPIALVLAAQGHCVDFAWAGGYAVSPEQPVPRSDKYWWRMARRVSRRFHHDRMSLIDLHNIQPSEATPWMREDAEVQALSDTSYIRLKERVDLQDTDDHRIYDYRCTANLKAISQLEVLLQQTRYDRVLLPSGGILEFGAVYRHLQRAGMQVLTYECSNTVDTIWFSTDAPVVALETGALWEADAPHILTPERKVRVDELMRRRRTPRSETLLFPFQVSPVEQPDVTRQRLGLAAGKPTVLICPNIPFDAAFSLKPGNLFKGMWEWFGITTTHLAKRSDVNVIIRCHPAERLFLNARETAQSLLAEFVPQLPAHFTVFGPEHPISTFSLIAVSDLGITYASTVGMEMAVEGLSVISGNSNHHYNRKGFTESPETLSGYLSAVDRVLANPKGSRMTARQIELAYCYMDLYFNDWHRSFPWTAWRQVSNWRDWPPDRVLSAEGMRLFGQTFNALAA